MHSSQLPNKRSKYMTKNLHYLICLKCHIFYIGSTRPLHIGIKKYLNARASSFYKHLIECKNNDNNLSIKTEAVK